MSKLINFRVILFLLGLPIYFDLISQSSSEFVKYNDIAVKSIAAPYQSYQLMISVPRSYHVDKNVSYPVVYVLDTEFNFGMVEEVYRKLNEHNDVPEMIIVGIGYGSSVMGKGNNRDRDMGPA